MGCAGLLDWPWTLKNKELVHKFVGVREGRMEPQNILDNTIQDRPEEWITKMWRAVYHFPSNDVGLANRMDTYIDDKFMHQVDPEDRYSMRDYRDARHHRLLEFMVLIIHPNKPTWVTITIGNTIFGALEGSRPVDWGLVFQDLVKRLSWKIVQF